MPLQKRPATGKAAVAGRQVRKETKQNQARASASERAKIKVAPCSHLKRGHEKGIRFRTPWEQLRDLLRRKACSPAELQSKFEPLQELAESDVGKLKASSCRKQDVDCRKAFFVSSENQARLSFCVKRSRIQKVKRKGQGRQLLKYGKSCVVHACGGQANAADAGALHSKRGKSFVRWKHRRLRWMSFVAARLH